MRLAVFNGDRQNTSNFLRDWENIENGSIYSAIEAYKLLVMKTNDNQEKYMYENPLTLQLI